MKRLWVLLLLIACYGAARAQVSVDSILIYKKFSHAGTTASIHSDFSRAGQADTLWLPYRPEAAKFTQLLNRAKTSHHFQQKEVVPIAALVYISGKKHYFILGNSHFVIDLTQRRNYRIKNLEDQAFIKEIFRRVGVEE